MVQESKGAAKDFDMSPFEAARKLLSGETERMSMSDRLELVFQDMDLVPLLIQVSPLSLALFHGMSMLSVGEERGGGIYTRQGWTGLTKYPMK